MEKIYISLADSSLQDLETFCTAIGLSFSSWKVISVFGFTNLDTKDNLLMQQGIRVREIRTNRGQEWHVSYHNGQFLVFHCADDFGDFLERIGVLGQLNPIGSFWEVHYSFEEMSQVANIDLFYQRYKENSSHYFTVEIPEQSKLTWEMFFQKAQECGFRWFIHENEIAEVKKRVLEK